MNLKDKFLFGIALLIIVLISFSCGKEAKNENGKKDERVNVEVTTLKGANYTDYISVVGTVLPLHGASLSSETGGIIDSYVNDKGSYVEKGDTILILEHDVLKANLDAAEAQYKLAQINFEKQKKIYNENVSSEFQYLNAKYNRDQVKAAYEQILARYNKTFITAPFNGIVDAKYYEVGELVPPTVAIVDLLNTNTLKIEAGIPERYAGDIELNAPTKVLIRELYNEPIDTKVAFVGKALNKDNRTFPIEVRINNIDGKIKPEMIAEVKIQRAIYDNVIIIPEEVVTRTDSGYIAFVAENGAAQLRKLDILSRAGEQVVVGKGLKPNDKLINLGYQNLVNGEKIKIVN